MASFKERYETLFGPLPDYDPIDLDAGDEAIESGLEQVDPQTREAIAIPYKPLARAPVDSGEVEFLDHAKALASGTVGTGEMLLGAAEYGARQFGGSDQSESVGGQILGDVAEGLYSARKSLSEVRGDLFRSMTPEAQDRIAREFSNLDPQKTIWQGGIGEIASAVSLKFSQALPATVLTLLPAARLFKAGMTPGAIVYLRASEGGLSMGSIANGITDEIMGMTQEQLLSESPRYAQLFQELDDETTARNQLIKEGQGIAPLVAGVVVGAISGTAGRYLEPVFTGGARVASRFGTGFLVEAAQEAPQSAVEQYVQNIAAKVYDADRAALAGVGEAAVEGGVIGGLTGGGFTALAGAPPKPPQFDFPPDTSPPPRPPASFDEVFTNQRPPPGGYTGAPPDDLFGPDPPDRVLPADTTVNPDPEAIPSDVAAAVSASIRADNMMPDMIDNIESFNPNQEGLILSGGLDTRPGVGRDYVPPGVPARTQQPPLPVEEGTQYRLSPPVRIRGQGRVPMPPGSPSSDRIQGVPTDLPFTEEEAAPTVDRVDPRQLEAGGQQRLPLSKDEQSPPLETEERAEPEAEDVIRKEVPFEERGEFTSTVKGATSPSKAAARLIGLAVKKAKPGLARRVKGFLPPDSLEFNEPRLAAQYADFFSELVDNQLAQELQQDSSDSGPERTKALADKESELITSLGRIRQIDKPKWKAAKSIGVAQKVSEATVSSTRRTATANANKADESQRDFFSGDDAIPQMSRKQLDATNGSDLTTLFARAAYWLAGQFRDVEIKPEWVADIPRNVREMSDDVVSTKTEKEIDPLKERARLEKKKADAADDKLELDEDEDIASIIRNAKGDPLIALVKAYSLPGQQRKLIRRVMIQMRRRKWGGKVKALDVTSKAAKKRSTSVGDVYKRTSGFDTAVLTRDTRKTDESKSDEMKREQRGKETYTVLGGTVKAAAAFLSRFDTKRSPYALLQNKRDENGSLTKEARNLRRGVEYFKQMVQFGSSLVQSNNMSSAAIQESDRVNKFLREAMKMEPEKFGNVFQALARAEEQESILAKPVGDDKNLGAVKAAVSDPVQRELITVDSNRERAANVLRVKNIQDNWHTNAFFRNLVSPVLEKLVGSYPGYYAPTQQELEDVKFSMNRWRRNETTKATLYDPLKRLLKQAGIVFDQNGDVVVPIDVDGKYSFSPSDEALAPAYRAKFGTVDEDRIEVAAGVFGGAVDQTASQINAARELAARRRAAADTRLDKSADAEQVSVLVKANGVIDRFLEKVRNNKTTINGLIRAEQRLIRALKALGVWQDTPSPKLGKVKLGTVRNYRIVGDRLISKQISKADARRLMGTIQPVQIPRGLRDAVSSGRQRKLRQTPLEQEIEFFLDVIDAPGNIDSFREAASAVGDILEDRSRINNVNVVLNAIANNVDENHPYGIAARKFLALNMEDVLITYDWNGKTVGKDAAKFKSDIDADGTVSRYVLLNRKALVKKRATGDAVEPGVIHTILHEIAHAATYRALKRSSSLQEVVGVLRGEALRQYKLRHGPVKEVPYGLRTDKPLDEFVAEAFSSTKFQDYLKTVELEGMSLWDRFIGLLARVFGFEGPAPKTAFDAIMLLEKDLFEFHNIPTPGEATSLNLEIADEALRPYISNALDKVSQSSGTLKRMWAQGLKAPLIAMTQEQIRENFIGAFGGKKGPLNQYMEAFFQRNAENSRLMEAAEKLSRSWTGLTEKYGTEQAVAFSVVNTTATLYSVAANKPLSDAANEHLTSTEAKARHKEAHAMFNALNKEWQDHYNAVQDYYKGAIERESRLMTINALRGLLTHGDDAPFSKAGFEEEFTPAYVATLNTREKLKDAIGEYLPAKDRDDLLATLYKMVTIPQQRQGNYSPLMRYGDYTVLAQKQLESKDFADRKEAYAYAAAKRETDPTLTVSVQPLDTGNYKVRTIVRDFRMAESRSEAEQHKLDMIEEYGAEAVSDVMLKRTQLLDTAIQSNAALNTIISKLSGNAAAQAAIKNYYLEALADSSFRKHEIRRKNRRGVDYELQHRNFTNYSKQSAYYTSQLQFGWKMADSMAGMQDYIAETGDGELASAVRLGEVFRELQKRDEMTVKPEVVSKVVRKGVELGQFFMLTSPSYWMINATQPWMVTLPWLAGKYSLGSAAAAMKNAQKLIISPLLTASGESWAGLKALKSKVAAEKAFGVLDQVIEQIKQRSPENASQYISMLEELRRNSIIDLSWIAELRDISEGRDTGLWQKVIDASRIMAHLTEVNNRILTAIAAYDLAWNAATDLGLVAKDAHTHAVKIAKQAVSQTQFNYSAGNKPRLFQQGGPLGAISPLVFQFMQWPQHMYSLLIQNLAMATRGSTDFERSEARRILAGVFATHLAAGGIIGAALQPIKWAMGLAMMALGDDDEPYTVQGAISGETFDRLIANATTDLLGPTVGGAVSKGLPYSFGADLSSRMSLGTLYYVDLKGDNVESVLGSMVSGFGGAFVNQTINWGRGIGKFIEGDYDRAFEFMLPKIGRDMVRFGRYANEGLLNNAGDTVITAEGLSAKDLFLQATGFQPSTVSKFYTRQAAIKDAEVYGKDRKSSLLKRFRLATSAEERSEVLRDVANFNKKFPSLRITRSSLLQSLQGKVEREARFQRYGANISEKSARDYEKYGEAYE